ncbi:unnamed protein product [Auanema sp. JU1783]|nr:unnamed protein product [Auanema sp. JU1783]
MSSPPPPSIEQIEKLEKDKFPIPSWAVKPPPGSHLDVLKNDQLIQKLMIDERKAYYFGRNPKMVDFAVEHASCSRVHALLLYHGVLNRFAIVDMGSSHGTFFGKFRLEPLQVVFVDIGTTIQFGASTRRYTLRVRVENSKDGEDEEKEKLPNDKELEDLTEYNTAINRRIPQLPISEEEARRKKRRRGNVSFIEEEDVINPEDVDPSVGRFRNLVSTAVISNNPGKRIAVPVNRGSEPQRKIIRPGRDFTFTSSKSSSLSGISLNAAPDLELYCQSLPKPGVHSIGPVPSAAGAEDDEPHKKKYAKEAWPGRKPLAGGVL